MTATIELRQEEFEGRLDTAALVAACDQAFRLYGSGALHNPPRSETVKDDLFRLEMPAAWPGRYRATKIIEERSDPASGRLGQRQAHIDLEDLVRHRQIRLEADYITDVRTGASGALGLHYLAKTPIRHLALIGTGGVAGSLALAADALLRPRTLRVTSRSAENRAAFVDRYQGRIEAEIQPRASIDACLDGADALMTAVPTAKPILDLGQLQSIGTAAVIGGDSRTRQLDPTVLEQLPVLVDLEAQAKNSGEFKHARQEGGYHRLNFRRRTDGTPADIGDLAAGRLAPARGPQLAYFTGLAVLDLCVAAAIYERVVNGTDLF